jgi:hypothetical protein
MGLLSPVHQIQKKEIKIQIKYKYRNLKLNLYWRKFMRRLNKKRKFPGMYATVSAERLKDVFKKELDKQNEKKKKEEIKKPILPKVVSVNKPNTFKATSVPASTPASLNNFDKEYEAFIDDLRKKKAEKEAGVLKTINKFAEQKKTPIVIPTIKKEEPKPEVKVEPVATLAPVPTFELPPEEPKTEVVEEKAVDDLKTVLEEIAPKAEEVYTTVEETKPRRRKRKKTAELA